MLIGFTDAVPVVCAHVCSLSLERVQVVVN